MSEMIPQDPKFTSSRIFKPLVYVGMAIFVYVLGFFLTPGIPDEVIGEIAWLIIIAFTEIKRKIDSSKQ